MLLEELSCGPAINSRVALEAVMTVRASGGARICNDLGCGIAVLGANPARSGPTLAIDYGAGSTAIFRRRSALGEGRHKPARIQLLLESAAPRCALPRLRKHPPLPLGDARGDGLWKVAGHLAARCGIAKLVKRSLF